MWYYHKTSNKQIRQAFEQYLKSETEYLWQVYGRWSNAKEQAYESCRTECHSMGGERFRIISANSQQFTVGWVAYDEQMLKRFYYITATYNRYMPLDTINKIDGTVSGTVLPFMVV